MSCARTDHAGTVLRGHSGEDDAPRKFGRPAPEFRVHEIGDPSQKKPRRRAEREYVRDAAKFSARAPAEYEQNHHHSEESAMKRHAALPYHQYFGRSREIVGGLVEQDVTQTPAGNDSDDDPGQQVVELLPPHRCPGAPDVRARKRPGGDKPSDKYPDDVGKRVPAKRKPGTANLDRENLGRDVRKWNRCQHECTLGHGVWLESTLRMDFGAFILKNGNKEVRDADARQDIR